MFTQNATAQLALNPGLGRLLKGTTSGGATDEDHDSGNNSIFKALTAEMWFAQHFHHYQRMAEEVKTKKPSSFKMPQPSTPESSGLHPRASRKSHHSFGKEDKRPLVKVSEDTTCNFLMLWALAYSTVWLDVR